MKNNYSSNIKSMLFILQETEKLAAKQRKLQREIDSLKSEKEHLEEIIKVHSIVCPEFTVS